MSARRNICFSLMLFLWGLLATGWGATTHSATSSDVVQAIQQAPDPSAAVAAYANGVAADRNNPRAHEAYVARMVDFGMPEIAYRQAQTLTTLEATNGLAWGVVAHVEARRGEMEEAVSAINLAGQFAPDHPLIQRTAGEILAWYDLRADKATIPDNAKDGVAKLREKIGSRTEFVNAYNTAQKAYQSQAEIAPPSSTPAPATNTPAIAPQSQVPPERSTSGIYYTQPSVAAPPTYAYATPPPVYYYDDYHYAQGPGWVAPYHSWWWRPYGSFIGFDFFPVSTVFVFDHHRHQHHRFRHRHHGHHGHRHGDFVHRDSNGRFFHRGGRDTRLAQSAAPSSRNTQAFFGSSARPDPRLRRQAPDSSFRSAPGLLSPGPAVRQGPVIPRPGTSSAPAVPAPRSEARQRSGVIVPRLPSGATLVPNSTTVRSTSPAAPNHAVRQGTIVPRRTEPGVVPSTAATAPVRDPAVRQGTLIRGRSSAVTVPNSAVGQGTAVAPAAKRAVSPPARDPAVRQGTLITGRGAPAAAPSVRIAPTNPNRSAPSPVVRPSPFNPGRSAPMVAAPSRPAPIVRSSPTSPPRSAPRMSPAPSRSFSAPANRSMGGRASFGGRSSGRSQR